jgi:ABC-type transporter MlaC component
MCPPVVAVLLLAGGLTGPSQHQGRSPDGRSGTVPSIGFGPIEELRRSDDELRRTLHRVVPEWSPEYELQKQDIHRLTSYLIDVDQFSRLALSDHWDRLTPTQREQFVSLIRTLIETSYIPRLNSDPTYHITYQREVINGTSAHVFGTISYRHNDVVNTRSVKYDLVRKDHHWVVYDITTDGESLLDCYRAQFDTVIRKHSVDALIEKLRRKVEACARD